jgi:Ni,Fe-hydrogenase I large subunit
MTRLVLDPVTRVGGHLRLEVELADGVVADAWVTGTMYRGVERILEGRDARDAWLYAQRVCGSCGIAHAITSARAVEQAVGITIPANARLVRNLMAGAQIVIDHAAGFYQSQALDWVDLASALDADPAATSTLARALSDRPTTSESELRAVQQRLTGMLGSTTPGPFAHAPWGHPAYALSPEANLMIAAHYLEALDWRREMMRFQVILGGKSPHPQTFLVGGMALAPEWGGPVHPSSGEHLWDLETASPAAISANGLADLGRLIDQMTAFIEGVYVPDVGAIMKAYGGRTTIEAGRGHFLSFGDFAEDDTPRPTLFMPRGRVMGADLSSVVQADETGVGESVDHSWYTSGADDGVLGDPHEARTEPVYSGPTPPFTSLEGFERYSWVKSPRYEDDVMEVGPLARLLVGIASPGEASGALSRAASEIGLDAENLFGSLGRTVARALEARSVARRLGTWLADLRVNLGSGDLAFADLSHWDTETWPREAEGVAIGESARGAVGHWVTIRDHRIERYQIVDATTWNGSPRDRRGRRGAIEQALIGTPVVDPNRPLELLRIVRSFDPCLTCAVH